MAEVDAWALARPILVRLPGESERYYQDPSFEHDPELDPPIGDWLTVAADEDLMGAKALMERFYEDHLDPATALETSLDWLAQFAGFTGEYWDAEWPTSIKRELIANAYPFIWEHKGSRVLLEWLISLFTLNAYIYQVGEFLAGIDAVPKAVGGVQLEYYVLVPSMAYLRTSAEWALLRRLNNLYGPIYCKSLVCYDQFYAGFSVAGDLVF